jgi:1-deoxy-D-xylulose-5-phosphate reductoisomerase
MPCALNAANEEAANAFLKGSIGFLQIADINASVMADHTHVEPHLENVHATDQWARETARSKMRLS